MKSKPGILISGFRKPTYFDKNYTNNNKLSFYFNNTNYLTLEFQRNLTAEPVSERSTL